MRDFFTKALPEPLRVPWGIGSSVVVFLGAWIVVPVVIVLVLSAVSHLVPAASWAHTLLQGLADTTQTDRSIQANFVLTLATAVVGLGLIGWFLRRYRASWQQVGWRSFSLVKAVGYLVALFLILAVGGNILLDLIQWLAPAFNASQPQTNDFINAAGSHPQLALVALVVVPPIIEETVFRGFIFPALATKWGVWGGALGSSVLFGFAHLQANVSIYTFVLGLLLCFMYTRLRSIFPGMALHMLNNYLAFIALTGPHK
ncbi:MAG TPA: type II CAAX endopeptidase family protein [Candidatus Saccharimonadia bacterium]|nr:type II CAAX endopeptidase family protein [Candidatus Saccharimonadia bacterium]